MGTPFCCPSCGTNLRVSRSVAAVVSCPSCGEAIRVPSAPHPVECSSDAPILSPPVTDSTRRGLQLLLASLGVFAAAAGFALGAVSLRLSIARLPLDVIPPWVPPVLVSFSIAWATCGMAGCVLRVLGYRACRESADAFGLLPWTRAAVVGAWLCVVGILAVAFALFSRLALGWPPPFASLLLIGTLVGLLGVGLEFAFLAVLHRLLWEASGWKEASRTSGYAVSFVFAVVGGMGAVCLAGMMALLLLSAQPPDDLIDPLTPPPVGVRIVTAVLLAALTALAAWLSWRYARLLGTARNALATPQEAPPGAHGKIAV